MEGTRGVNAINITSSGEVNGLLGCFLVEDGSLRVSSGSQPACLTLFKPHTRIEHLHEEYAWYLYRKSDQPEFCFSTDPNEETTDYYAIARSLVNEAKDHLYWCLSRKLGTSLVEAKKDPAELQLLAEERSKHFKTSIQKEEYLDGVSYIMRSMGHMNQNLGGLVSRTGASAVERERDHAFAQKRTSQTKSRPV